MVTEIRPEDDVMAEHKEQMEKLKRIEKAKTLPVINTEDSDKRSGDRVIGASGDRKTGEQGLPRMDADDRGSEKQNLPLMNTENNDLNGGIGKILPQSVGSGAEVYANRDQNSEMHANLG